MHYIIACVYEFYLFIFRNIYFNIYDGISLEVFVCKLVQLEQSGLKYLLTYK